MLIVGLLILLGVGGYYVYANRAGNNEVNPQTNQPTAAVTQTPSATGSGDAEQVKMIEVEAGSFYFRPNELRVKKGEKVKLTLSAVDMMHDFVVDELGIKAPITKSGTTSTVEFTADEVGEFEYYCSVGNHKAQGQVGTLIVEE